MPRPTPADALYARFKKIVDRAERGSTPAERATAKKILGEFLTKHPEIASLHQRMAGQARTAKQAKDAASKFVDGLFGGANADPFLRYVSDWAKTMAGKMTEDAFRALDEQLASMEEALNGMNAQPDLTFEERLLEEAEVKVSIDDRGYDPDVDDVDEREVKVVIKVPRHLLEEDFDQFFDWVSSAVDEALEELDDEDEDQDTDGDDDGRGYNEDDD